MYFSKTPGYTLIEMLVVISILALLSALLLPVLFQSRRRAHDATCESNLQQISHALSMYLADNSNEYPPGTDGIYDSRGGWPDRFWLNHLEPYLHSIPRRPDVDLPWRIAGYRGHSAFAGYALNRFLNGVSGTQEANRYVGQPDFKINYPGTTITVCDSRGGIIGLRGPDLGKTEQAMAQNASPRAVDFIPEILAQTEGALRHHGGAFYAFADGHAAWLQPEQVQSGPRNDGVHPGFGI